MTLPPFANLFAVHDADPATLDEILRDLQRSQEFAEVWRPAPGWVAAVAPLPDSAPDGEPVRHYQLAFAEGRDVLVDGAGTAPAARCRELAELADVHPDRLGSVPGDFGFIRFRPTAAPRWCAPVAGWCRSICGRPGHAGPSPPGWGIWCAICRRRRGLTRW